MSIYFRRIYISLVAVFCLTISSVYPLQADEPSAEEIMAKSRVAMSQPLRYTSVSADGKEMVVYRKTLPNGSIASLTNSSSTKRITIAYDETRYEIHLEHQIAIDMSYLPGGANYQADSSLFSDMDHGTPKNSLEFAGIVKYNDKDCYEILETISPEVRRAILARLPENAKNRFRAKSRILIDKENYLIQTREELTVEETTISKIEYRDIASQPDLSDDFFQLPPGLEVLTPKSPKEYLAIVADRFVPKRPLVDREEEMARIKKEQDERLAMSRAETEKIKAEFEKKVAEDKERAQELLAAARDSVMSPEYYPLPESSGIGWVRTLLMSAGIICIILGIIYFLKRKL